MQNSGKCKKKFTVTDNDVSAVGQMRNSNEVYYLGKENANKRLLIVGNSITRHGPLAEIGWEHDWGMAASAPECDYVHLLTSRLFETEELFVMVGQRAHWEMNYKNPGELDRYDEDNRFMADEIIFRLGENVKPLQNDEEEAAFLDAILAFIARINPKGGKVYFTTCFWKNERVDRAIRNAAERLGMPLIDLNALGDDEKHMAIGLFEHQGVAHHPGDYGMACIADLLYQAMRG